MSDENAPPPTPADSPGGGPFAFLSRTPSGQSPGPGAEKPRRRWARVLLILTALLIAAGIVTVASGAIYYHGRALAYDLSLLREVPQRTLVYDRERALLGHVSGHGENRLVVPVSDVSEHFISALLAREDSRYFHHGGVDYRGVARAIVENVRRGDMEQGASTLTMQLARNTYGMREKTIGRKLQEVALARRIERRFSKDEILGFYINRIYFGAGLYGIERAAQGFFEKPASELTLGESAMLAGIIRGPSLLNPFRSLEDAKAARDEVLGRMLAEELITETEALAARAEPVVLRPPGERLATGSYVLQLIHDLLAGVLDPIDIKQGGLRVYTTIDSDLQERAARALDRHLSEIEARPGFPHPPRRDHPGGSGTETNYVQGAVVSIDNSTGGFLALVGGRDFGESPFNRAVQARRQAGSTFKPFVYAVAFDRGGLLPGDYVSDDPIRLDSGGGKIWSPQNSDGTFTGLQPAAIGLIRSRNTMSVRVGQIAGLRNVLSLSRALKFGEIPESPVSYLGAMDTTLTTITSAYSTFPAGGFNREPYLIERIEDAGGNELFQTEIRSVRVFRESVCWLTNDILGKVMDEGTGRSARRLGYEAPACGKTGTTNDYRDAWFVGYTDKITTGVWVGMDRPQTIMNRGYGSTLALPVWTAVMQEAEEAGFPAQKIPAPTDARETLICRECGNLATRRTTRPYVMPLPPDLTPAQTCPGHGSGIFTGLGDDPRRARPLPDDGNAYDPRLHDPAAPDGRILRQLGRWLFGGGER